MLIVTGHDSFRCRYTACHATAEGLLREIRISFVFKVLSKEKLFNFESLLPFSCVIHNKCQSHCSIYANQVTLWRQKWAVYTCLHFLVIVIYLRFELFQYHNTLLLYAALLWALDQFVALCSGVKQNYAISTLAIHRTLNGTSYKHGCYLKIEEIGLSEENLHFINPAFTEDCVSLRKQTLIFPWWLTLCKFIVRMKK